MSRQGQRYRTCRAVEGFFKVPNTKAKRDSHNPSQTSIHHSCPYHALWKRFPGVPKLFGHMNGGISSNERINAACDANESRTTKASPTTTVVELCEDLLG